MSDKARIAAGAAATRSKMDQATALISGLAGACVRALICASARVRCDICEVVSFACSAP